MGAKKFTLQAVDGAMNCLFWEIVCHLITFGWQKSMEVSKPSVVKQNLEMIAGN